MEGDMKNMKKLFCILTVALLSFALLAGCGSSGDKLSDPAAIEAYAAQYLLPSSGAAKFLQ